jgi:hypothetical protein
LTGRTQELSWVVDWLPSLRPSKALGLLQFAKQYGNEWQKEVEISLPRLLEIRPDRTLKWHVSEKVRSLEQADAAIRTALSIPLDRKIPLLAD